MASPMAVLVSFQSTLLMRGATYWIERHFVVGDVFQSTLLMRGATQSTTMT